MLTNIGTCVKESPEKKATNLSRFLRLSTPTLSNRLTREKVHPKLSQLFGGLTQLCAYGFNFEFDETDPLIFYPYLSLLNMHFKRPKIIQFECTDSVLTPSELLAEQCSLETLRELEVADFS